MKRYALATLIVAIAIAIVVTTSLVILKKCPLPVHKLSDNVIKGTVLIGSSDNDVEVLVYNNSEILLYNITLDKIIMKIQVKGQLVEYKRTNGLDLPKTFFILSKHNNRYYIVGIRKDYEKIEKLFETETESNKIAFYNNYGDKSKPTLAMQKNNIITLYNFEGKIEKQIYLEKENAFVYKNSQSYMNNSKIVGFDGQNINIYTLSEMNLKLLKSLKTEGSDDIYEAVRQRVFSQPENLSLEDIYTIKCKNFLYLVKNDSIEPFETPEFTINYQNMFFLTKEGIIFRDFNNKSDKNKLILEGNYKGIYCDDTHPVDFAKTFIYNSENNNINKLILLRYLVGDAQIKIYNLQFNPDIISTIKIYNPPRFIFYTNDGVYYIDWFEYINNWKDKYDEQINLHDN